MLVRKWNNIEEGTIEIQNILYRQNNSDTHNYKECWEIKLITNNENGSQKIKKFQDKTI